MAKSSYRDVSTILASYLDPETFGKGNSFSTLHTSWQKIAGERLAAHTRPVDVEKHVLIVEAEHPGWIQLLQLSQNKILVASRAAYPELEIHSIAFRLEKNKGSIGTRVEDVEKKRENAAQQLKYARSAYSEQDEVLKSPLPVMNPDEQSLAVEATKEPVPEVSALFEGLRKAMAERKKEVQEGSDKDKNR